MRTKGDGLERTNWIIMLSRRLPMGRQRRGLPALLCLLAIASGIVCCRGGEDAKKDKKERGQEYYQSFKGQSWEPQVFKLMGPNADKQVQAEPAGLRITLPAGVPGEGTGTGLVSHCVVQGDFEITVGYEILQEPQAATAKEMTRFSLGISLDRPKKNMASFSRQLSPRFARTQYLMWQYLTNEATGKDERADSIATPDRAGQLRLVRTGDVLAFEAAPGFDAKFDRLKEYPFGREDLKEIRIVGATGGPQASLDVRVFDLRVRATALPTLSPPAAAAAPQAERKGFLAATLLVGLLLIVFYGLWLYQRSQRRSIDSSSPTQQKNAR
jgi:hypothetical protein